jgi:hypothetical protein
MPHTIEGPGSIDRRPDTFSWSYLTCFTFGPVAIADFSQGTLNRVWKFRCDGNAIYGARQADSVSYDPEFLLFEFAGVPAVEIDAAFDQQGRVFICAERPTGLGGAPEVWAYYFDPFAAAFVFVAKGSGRTPRALLDDPNDTALGDILLFYMNDNRPAICYRQQRDRYDIEYLVQEANGGVVAPEVYGPITGDGNYDGITVETATFQGPPVPHFFPPTRGDFQSSSAVDGRITLYFSEPIKTFSMAIHYPNQNGNTMYAVQSADDFIGTGGLAFVALGFKTFKSVEGDVQTLSFDEGFQYVVIKPTVIGQETGQLTRSPTYGDAVFQIVRDTTINAPITVSSLGRFIEDVYKAIDSRVHILYSERNIPLGTYKLGHIESVLYPQRMATESFQPIQTALLGDTLATILLAIYPTITDTVPTEQETSGQADTDIFQPFQTNLVPEGSELHETQIQLVMEIESIQALHTAFAAPGTLLSTLMAVGPAGPDFYDSVDSDQPFQTILIPAGASLLVVLIPMTMDIESFQPVQTALIAAGSSLA